MIRFKLISSVGFKELQNFGDFLEVASKEIEKIEKKVPNLSSSKNLRQRICQAKIYFKKKIKEFKIDSSVSYAEKVLYLSYINNYVQDSDKNEFDSDRLTCNRFISNKIRNNQFSHSFRRAFSIKEITDRLLQIFRAINARIDEFGNVPVYLDTMRTYINNNIDHIDKSNVPSWKSTRQKLDGLTIAARVKCGRKVSLIEKEKAVIYSKRLQRKVRQGRGSRANILLTPKINRSESSSRVKTTSASLNSQLAKQLYRLKKMLTPDKKQTDSVGSIMTISRSPKPGIAIPQKSRLTQGSRSPQGVIQGQMLVKDGGVYIHSDSKESRIKTPPIGPQESKDTPPKVLQVSKLNTPCINNPLTPPTVSQSQKAKPMQYQKGLVPIANNKLGLDVSLLISSSAVISAS
ncbi:hypothetical protein DID75_01400 [Candidatus Marinamargulisbacteria bacterium SCGC AG-410-N11]|nr:hypothetical protein DID75_01400 [Candidatus Marinamargulisbacteria bacterium SCGC AG-410-N11]